MAAAVMTRHSNKPRPAHKTRSTPVPSPLELNGAASRESLLIHSAMANDSEGYNRGRSCTEGERRRKEKKVGGKRGGRERSSRLVVNGELVYAELSPKTEESISQVFSFDTRTVDFEENMNQVWPHRCTFVVRELIQTERAYVKALGEIIKGYITPLYGYLLSSGDGPSFIQTVFSNIVKIHHYHLDLLDLFQSLCSQPKELVQLFLDRDFSLYTMYCTNFSKGNDRLEYSLANNPNLQSFIKECQMKLHHSLPLHSHLIKPVQRILKYPLLLEELLKNFDDMHEAYPTVEEAYRKMTEVAEHINSSFHKPVKKNRLTPSAIARIRSKEVEGLQRRRSLMVPSLSPVHRVVSTPSLNRHKRSASMEPEDMNSIDKPCQKSHKRIQRHKSVEDLLSNGKEKEVQLARVSELKAFFENLIKADAKAVVSTPVVEVAPLERRQWSICEKLETLEETSREYGVEDGRTHAEWPPLRKTGRRLVSPRPEIPMASVVTPDKDGDSPKDEETQDN